MEGIKILKKPRLKKPYLIAAWPGMGEVAFKAASYLVEKLGAKEFAQLAPAEFFYLTGSFIQDGVLDVPELPQGKFYYWKNKGGRNDLVVFISNSQPDLTRAEEYSRRITAFAAGLNVEKVISLASMPQPIDHTQKPAVWGCATSAELKPGLKNFGLNLLPSGQVSGMNGLFLGIAKKDGLKGFCLLAEIPLYTIQIENPRASYAVLDALCKILDIRIDFSALIEQAQSMGEEIDRLFEYLKLGGQGQPAPIGEEEIEKIKKTLSQLTRLPVSVKEKIEKLFEETRTDATRASELKAELDKWNVYREYEDRFLDLFRKGKDKGN